MQHKHLKEPLYREFGRQYLKTSKSKSGFGQRRCNAWRTFAPNVTAVVLVSQEEKMRDKPGFEHLKEPLHVHIEAEMPLGIVDAQLSQAVEIIHELIKPVVSLSSHSSHSGNGCVQ